MTDWHGYKSKSLFWWFASGGRISDPKTSTFPISSSCQHLISRGMEAALLPVMTSGQRGWCDGHFPSPGKHQLPRGSQSYWRHPDTKDSLSRAGMAQPHWRHRKPQRGSTGTSISGQIPASTIHIHTLFFCQTQGGKCPALSWEMQHCSQTGKCLEIQAPQSAGFITAGQDHPCPVTPVFQG